VTLMKKTNTVVGIAIAAALLITGATSAGAKTPTTTQQQQLQSLYQKAKAEGGKLTV
jgi:hypothetical protein